MDLNDILDIVRACRRSRVKLRVYGALIILRVATPAELADRARTTVDRVFEVMLGSPDYRADTSLLRLRVADWRDTEHGPSIAITDRGDRAYASVLSRLER